MSLNISYKLEYSEFLKRELNRLKDGVSTEKQRFQNIISTTARVQSNPLAHIFKKDLPDDYKAADVLQQYRLFFKITNIDDKNSVIFFTWVNDEKSFLHDSAPSECEISFVQKTKKERSLYTGGDI